METQNGDNRRRKFCIIDVHRASYINHLKIQKMLEIAKIIPINFFNDSNESNKTNKKIHNPKPLEKQQEKELEQMISN